MEAAVRLELLQFLVVQLLLPPELLQLRLQVHYRILYPLLTLVSGILLRYHVHFLLQILQSLLQILNHLVLIPEFPLQILYLFPVFPTACHISRFPHPALRDVAQSPRIEHLSDHFITCVRLSPLVEVPSLPRVAL